MIRAVRSDLPAGTVTFLFTDVEGSTRLLHELGPEAYAEVLAEHRQLVRQACTAEGGIEVDTQGDAFFFAFPTALGALAAAEALTQALASGRIRVRVGLHTGTPLLTDEGYVGADVHRAARIASAGHGGQVLVSASTAVLAQTDGLRDLGEHRLKDLSAPERIHQLGDGDFPPLKTLYRTNLPVPATPFLGRQAELAAVVELLTGDGLPLLTLTGPGGTGKTRLALQAAAAASESFSDGVLWVPLAPLRDPELVLPTLAQTLSVSEEAGKPLEETLVAYLSGKSVLLLLDDLEHLLPQAAERIAALRASNGSCLLVTSRERLRIGGEQTWRVPPLGEADGRALRDPRSGRRPRLHPLARGRRALHPPGRAPARARAGRRPDSRLLGRAATRASLAAPRSLKRGSRRRSPAADAQATIEWSHDLLTEEEQLLFARLAVFVGGCTYEAAEEIAGADPDTLQSLLDKSLLRKRETALDPRYWMLETIREFAAERLEVSGEAAEVQPRQADWFLRLAEEAFPHLLGSPGDWLDRLVAEHDNLRAALDHFEGSGDVQSALQLAGALYRFWFMHGHLGEGGRRLEGLLAKDARQTPMRGRALQGAAAMAMNTGETATMRARAEEALSLHHELGDEWGVAYARMMLGNVAAVELDFESALVLYEEAAHSFGEVGDQHYSVGMLNAMAHCHGELGDRERERTIHEDALRLARLYKNDRVTARSLYSLSWFALNDGRPEDSKVLVEEALATYRRLGEVGEVSMGVRRLSWAVAADGRAHSAAQLLAAAESLREEIGAWLDAWVLEMDKKTLTAIRDELDEAAFAKAWEQGASLTVDEAISLVHGRGG